VGVVVEDAEDHVGGQEDEVAAADQQDGPVVKVIRLFFCSSVAK